MYGVYKGDKLKKFFKKLFSRFPLVALTIIMLILLFFAVIVGAIIIAEALISEHFPTVGQYIVAALSALDWLIVACTVLHAANRDMVPETKIPWILSISVLNLLGVFIYALFSSHRPTRRERKQYKLLYEQSKPYTERKFSKETLRAELGHWADVSESLYVSEPAAVVRGGTKTEYFSSGEAFFPRVIEDLERAEKFIFLEYFIIEEGKFWNSILSVLERKAQEGLDVRVMYDDIGSMGKVRAGYYKQLRKAGIRCIKFNPFVPVVTTVHNNRDHRKILVIDGKIGYTGGLNLADEYINETHPFGYWKDVALRLEGEGVTGLTRMFLGIWQLKSKQMEDLAPFLTESHAEGEGYVQPYGSGPVPLFERHLAEDVYVNILNAAHDYVYIMTPYLIIDYRMKEALILAAKRGVDVRLITPHIPDKKLAFGLTRSNYMALIKGGVKVYEFTPGFVHAKVFLSDDRTAVVGTVNLDYRSFLYHYEDGVVMYQTECLKDIAADFEETFSRSALQTEEDAKKSVVWRGLCEIAKIFAPLF